LLLATRLLRGEEEAGRWEVLLSGLTTRAGAAAQAVAGLGVGAVALWTVTALAGVASGASPKAHLPVTGTLLLAVALTSGPLVFLGVGAVCSQLAGTRKQANAIGASALGGAYLIRLVADAEPSLHNLRWASPFGWVEEMHPLTGSQLLPLVPIALATVALFAVAVRLAAQRDVGASALPSRDTHPPRLALLTGPTGLTIRLTLPIAIAWTAALATLGFVFGLVAQAAGGAVSGSQTIERMLARLGGRQGGALSYLGLSFAFAAALVAFVAAAHIASTRAEEAEGYVDNLLVRPVSRRRWFGARLAVGAGVVSVASVMAGVGAWVGAASQHTGVGFGDLVRAGVNIAPPAVFVLGVGALLFGAVPRRAAAITYAVVAWSFLVQIVAAIITTNRILLDSSLFHHMAPAPATDPNWGSALGMLGIGAVAALVGLAAFSRRDVVGT
jgi:ABC-2 type transport system permease protein